MLEKMVVLLQQSVPSIYATCFSNEYSMKLRLLSRTWPNISKLEHTVYKKVQMAESYQNQKKWKKKKKKNSFRESWLGPPPFQRVWKYCVFFVFPRFLPSVGYFKENGMNHKQSCQSALGNAVKRLKISC